MNLFNKNKKDNQDNDYFWFDDTRFIRTKKDPFAQTDKNIIGKETKNNNGLDCFIYKAFFITSSSYEHITQVHYISPFSYVRMIY